MRTARILIGAMMAGSALFGAAGTAAADTASPSPTASDDATPTEAGTTFRTATAIPQDQRALAHASTGDYLYWSFPADAAQRATVNATVTLPDSATRHGASAWRLDVYDGLRRRQACMYGAQTRRAATDTRSVELSCTLRTVRAWAEPWANDPLPGTYYVRLTVVDLPEQDLGLPVQAAVEATSVDTGGAQAVDGSLAAPLTPRTTDPSSSDEQTPSPTRTAAAESPEDTWSSGWWSDRWIWTVAAGVLAALAGIAGYTLARGPRHATRMQQPGA
ncbi:hypothetical protein [Streptomyces sp. TR06-5]|uniref:hypothetical protein n=1 Tax=unclassified Streptomyces TaxID=2593676 RepID=UPI00399F83E6